jgi:hypothetical protein
MRVRASSVLAFSLVSVIGLAVACGGGNANTQPSTAASASAPPGGYPPGYPGAPPQQYPPGYPQQQPAYAQPQPGYPAQPAAAPGYPAPGAQPAPAPGMAPAAPAATGAPMSTPGLLALPCQNDSTCGLHHCNTQFGKCAFPCQTPTDCVSGGQCVMGVCLPGGATQ